MFFVYILEATDKNNNLKYYTGYTNNLVRKFYEYASSRDTKFYKRKELNLLYYEIKKTRSEAMRRELQIKKMSYLTKKTLTEKFNNGVYLL